MFNIKNPFSSKLETKLSVDEIQIALLAIQDANWTEMTYAKAAVNGYVANPFVYRCVNLRGDSIGSLRWTVVDKDGKEKPNHPLQTLIDRPNKRQSQSEFFSALSKYRDLGGDGYIIANRDGMAKPRELMLARPDEVTIAPGQFGLPGSYHVSSVGYSKTFTVDPVTGQSDILNWKLFNPLSDLIGLSPLSAASKAYDTFNEAQNHSKKLLQNGANLGGVLSTDMKLDKEQLENLAKQIEAKYAGTDNSGKMMITDGGMKYSSTSISPKNLLLIELQTEQARYIAQALSIPDQLIGIPGSSTFANFAEARIYYLENTVIPMAESLQESLNYWLTPMFGDDVTIKYDVDSIAGLEERRAEKMKLMEGVSFMTINEKRRAVGLEDIVGGNGLNTTTSKPSEPETDENNEETE